MKSFYVLELRISPGGARRWTRFAYPTLAQIQQALEVDLWVDLTLSDGTFLLDCDESVELHTFIVDDEKTRIVNLRELITLHGANGATLPLSAHVEKGKNGGENRVWTRQTDDGVAVFDHEFFGSVRASVDWGVAPVLPLKNPLLEVGEVIRDFGDYDVQYGCQDLDGGWENDEQYREWAAEYLEIDPDWLRFGAGAVRGLVDSMHVTGDYTAMPILADALQEAGCENELFLWHCRAPARVHARGSWLVELLRRNKANGGA
jgi:hypothetical protein